MYKNVVCVKKKKLNVTIYNLIKHCKKWNSLLNLINFQSDTDKILKIHLKQNFILIIQKLLLNTRMIWMIFMKVLKNEIQIKTGKY